jgi:hypothetical protein
VKIESIHLPLNQNLGRVRRRLFRHRFTVEQSGRSEDKNNKSTKQPNFFNTSSCDWSSEFRLWPLPSAKCSNSKEGKATSDVRYLCDQTAMTNSSSLSRSFPVCFHHHSIDVVHGVEIQVIAMIGVMMLIPDVTDLVRAVAIDRHIRQQFVALPVI